MFSKVVLNKILIQLTPKSLNCNTIINKSQKTINLLNKQNSFESIITTKSMRYLNTSPSEDITHPKKTFKDNCNTNNNYLNAITERLFSEDVLTQSTGNNKRDLNAIDLSDTSLVMDRRIDALSEEIDYELLDEISPTLGMAFNLSAFADKSETIQMFIKLGVDLATIERKSPKTAEHLLKLDFEVNCKPYIRFLVDNGVNPSDLGYFFSKNPTIFWEHLDDLKVRINYLESKRFDRQMIASVLTKAPKLLNQSTKYIDYKLAFIQKEFGLTANEVRHVLTSYPRIALLNDMSYRELSFILKEEFGFNALEIKKMLLNSPLIFRKLTHDKFHRIAVKVFDLIHNEMQIPHELIAKTPGIFTRRLPRIECRHLYLKYLGRNQYNPKEPQYVPLSAFYELADNEFCDKYAKTTVRDFNLFCKTL